MKVLNQNNAIDSLEKSLIPAATLIDGRTERDRLAFLAEFGSLINFYDQNNNLHGNWLPFLLKDPVFLLAGISKTEYSRLKTLYNNTCNKLERILASGYPLIDLDSSLDQLFNQLTELFMRIERWTFYMQMNHEQYNLKKYIFSQVKDNISQYLWAILSLREQLAISSYLGVIEPVKYYIFNEYDELLWKQGSGKAPFEEILGITQPLFPETKTEEEIDKKGPIQNAAKEKVAHTCYSALKNAGDLLFKFFHTIIQHSVTEYEKLASQKSRHPDTTLIRTFVNLLQVQQEQLNEISKKHLEFYYADILKQTKQPAIPDNVFIYALLAKKDNSFDLPVGTKFNAGVDQNNQPVFFATLKGESLYPAVINSAYTLAGVQNTNVPISILNIPGPIPISLPIPQTPLTSLYLQKIAKPGVIATDESGNTKTWETFGGAINQDGTAAEITRLGFAFASPMLYLLEGERNITIDMTFDSKVGNVKAFPQYLSELLSITNSTYYLSTMDSWEDVTEYVSPTAVSSIITSKPDLQASFSICLPISVPAIQTLAKNIDGLNISQQNLLGQRALWPTLKIIYNSLPNLSSPPVIKSINISVTVNEVKTFQLYNDNNLLSTKAPFQPFGPIPNRFSNFIIGNNEIFSKKLSNLTIEFDWDSLPTPQDFSAYYKPYNDYLNTFPPGTSSDSSESTSSAFANVNKMAPPVVNEVSANRKKGLQTVLGIGAGLITGAVAGFFINKIAGSLIGIQAGMLTGALGGLLTGVIVGLLTAKLTGLLTGRSSPKPDIKPAVKPSINAPTITSSDPLVKVPPLVPFDNKNFNVNFSILQDQAWKSYPNTTDKNITIQPLFTPDNSKAIDDSRIFTFTNPTNSVDPSIQNGPTAFSNTSSYGFLKMTLNNPLYAFGASIYGSVVSWVALQNAQTIANSVNSGTRKTVSSSKVIGLTIPTNSTTTLTPPPPVTNLLPSPNVPFPLKVQLFKASYTASHNYDLTGVKDEYPLQCFYYTPFTQYTVYDNTAKQMLNCNYIVGPPSEIPVPLQLFSPLPCNGALFFELTNLLEGGNLINLLFELAVNYSSAALLPSFNYCYLSSTGWKTLPVVFDGTNGFSCTGIITLNIPDDATNKSALMPGNNFWIAITATGDISSISQAVLVATNGIELQRHGIAYLDTAIAPKILGSVISRPQSSIPQIASVIQPFPSFGGRAAEDQTQMNRHVSNLLKTKGRAVSTSDFFRLIRQEFPDIYYSQALFDSDGDTTNICVAKGFDNPADANAFSPAVSSCEVTQIQKFLHKRVSLFSNIKVSNFKFQYVQIVATVSVKQGFGWQSMKSSISQLLNIFLSPWISVNNFTQVVIDEGISTSQVADFIMGIDGVSSVISVSFSTSFSTPVPNNAIAANVTQPIDAASAMQITPTPGLLFVSSLNHLITINPQA